MGFLYQIMIIILKDPNVTTYYNASFEYVKNLEKHLNKGQHGLSLTVAAIQAWYGYYEKELEKKLKNIRNPLNELETKITTHFALELNEEKAKSLATQHSEWTKRAQEYAQQVNEAQNACEKLDPALRRKLEMLIRLINAGVSSFEASCKNRNLQHINRTVGSELVKLRATIEKIILKRIGELSEDLKEEFELQIDIPIKNAKAQLMEIDNDLKQWIATAEKVAEEAIGKRNKLLDTLKSAKNESIKKSAERLKNSAVQLLRAYEKAHQKLVESVIQCKRQMKQFDEQLRTELYQVRTQIIQGVKQYVRELVQKVRVPFGTISRGIKEGSAISGQIDLSIETHWKELNRTINLLVKQINGAGDAPLSGGLTRIVQGVTEYSNDFGRETFKIAVLNKWVREIVDTKETIVSSRLGEYASYNNITATQGGSNGFSAKYDAVKAAIISKLPEHIYTDISSAAAKHLKDAKLDTIAEKFESFASDVERELTGDVAPSIGKAMKEIEEVLTLEQGKSKYRNYLETALRSIAKSIVKSIKNFASELKRFVESSKIKNLPVAIGHVTQIGNQFNGNHGIDLSLQALKLAIDQLDSTLTHEPTRNLDLKVETQLPENNGTIHIEKAPTLSSYGKNKNTVRESIMNFDAVLEAFKPLVDSSGQGAIVAAIAEVEALENEILKQLTVMTNLLNKSGNERSSEKGVKNMLKELCEMLTNGDIQCLQNIEKLINGLVASDITKLITEAEKFHVTIKNATEQTIEQISADVKPEFEGTALNVKKKAQEICARTKKTELGLLQKTVYEQIDTIWQVIDDDLASGIKQLINTFSDGNNAGKKLDDLKNALDGPAHGEKVISLSTKFKEYSEHLFTYLLKNMQKHFTSQRDVNGAYTTKVSTIQRNLTALLTHISTHKHFDHLVPSKLDTLKTSVTSFKSTHFGNASYPVLDAFPRSLEQFVGELERMYVSRYEGGEGFDCNLVDAKYELRPLKEPETVYTLTDKGRKAAKIFLTLFNTIYEDLVRLKNRCEDNWGHKKLCKLDGGKDNPLGLFLQGCGYMVAQSNTSKDGETQCKTSRTGADILAKVTANIDGRQITSHLLTCESNLTQEGEKEKTDEFNFADLLDCLLHHVNKYNDVCHMSTLTATRQPCSVYEMLVWLSGLPHSPVYTDMKDLTTLGIIDGLNKKEEDEFSVSFVDDNNSYLEAYPDKVTHNGVQAAVTEICSKAYDTVVCIAGTGDAQTVYGCDYSNNAFNFYYPQDGEGCLDMLLDVLRRLFPPLKFLQNQCKYRSNNLGWRDCQYGMDVPTGKSQCTEHPRDHVTDQPKCQPTCQANSKVSCQPNSPLMCYLTDCHVGCLPHKLNSIGCKTDCTTCPSNKPGMPCLTPLGFRGFSGKVKRGEDICEVIGYFFGSGVISSLLCLFTKPPSTLPEHFQFVSTLVNMLNSGKRAGENAVSMAFDASTKKLSVDLYKDSTKLTSALRNAYQNDHSHEGNEHHKAGEADLSTLSKGASCVLPTERNIHCAPYLSSTCCDAYYYLAKKHSDLYLSWAVYLPWAFYNYLKSLLGAFQRIDCGGAGCRKCSCKPGKHGIELNCKCKALVSCSGVKPTFYQYGFTFGDVKTLDGTNRKYCHNFHSQLSNVLKSKYCTELFNKCDDFLFTIRQPFIWLTVALWSLSLFYLICVMVGRLDVLHIKSHLRIPSSHKITAQSLLAAAQVGRLAKISYLQP